jgi:hypothetical protein
MKKGLTSPTTESHKKFDLVMEPFFYLTQIIH